MSGADRGQVSRPNEPVIPTSKSRPTGIPALAGADFGPSHELRERLAGAADPREPLIAWEQVSPGRWEGVVWEMWDGAVRVDGTPGQFTATFQDGHPVGWVARYESPVALCAPAESVQLRTLFDAKVWAADMWRRVSS